ncbi:MAG: NADH (or F420H2) dehydrogenase subunit C [Chloroflexi bacterium OLB15]|nr:MAG: NADH (or F420H2) dehydrogenase subunit C [Chloroflexi bacterium OLB15]
MHIPDALAPAVAFEELLPGVLKGTHEFRGELTLIVDPADVERAVRFLRDTRGLIFNYLSDISAVDYFDPIKGYGDYGDRPARFGVSYHLYSLLYNRRIRLKTFVDEDVAIPTITTLWDGANWLEREIFDMMGIPFEGHPNLRRVLMPEDWEGHPHRRDYPLGYETIMFSFNADEINKHKPYAKD